MLYTDVRFAALDSLPTNAQPNRFNLCPDLAGVDNEHFESNYVFIIPQLAA